MCAPAPMPMTHSPVSFNRTVPDGFMVLHDHDPSLWLACTEALANCYAVHVRGKARPIIAHRVETARIPHALQESLQHAVVWNLGISAADAERCKIVVHRPFGPILEF